MATNGRRENPWNHLRFALGMAQMAGATLSVVLLFRLGVTPATLLAVVATCACTSVSVLLFGSRRRHDDPRDATNQPRRSGR